MFFRAVRARQRDNLKQPSSRAGRCFVRSRSLAVFGNQPEIDAGNLVKCCFKTRAFFVQGPATSQSRLMKVVSNLFRGAVVYRCMIDYDLHVPRARLHYLRETLPYGHGRSLQDDAYTGVPYAGIYQAPGKASGHFGFWRSFGGFDSWNVRFARQKRPFREDCS